VLRSLRSSEAVGPDTADRRKARGAFFTPPAIADYLAAWAVDDDPNAKILDPTCGEAVFLLAAGRRLKELGRQANRLDEQVFGVDLHEQSLNASMSLLEAEDLDAHLLADDFFNVPTPYQLGSPLPLVDAVIGNPPFVRYQEHTGLTRKRSVEAALAQGVRLSGLASSWAALVVHACGFLKPEGRLAMVLPAELLTVHYAEPIRRWLRGRFETVNLVMFDELQFHDALEKVVLVVARGSGTCESFSLFHVRNAEELAGLRPFNHLNVTPVDEGKWTELLLPSRSRKLFRSLVEEHFVPLASYGAPELGTVTGANSFFALSEETRRKYRLTPNQVKPISPPGTRHLRGLSFTPGNWADLRDAGEAVWLLHPDPNKMTVGLQRYIDHGESEGVEQAYKCQIRTPWWRPPAVSSPDLFFTYMSHRFPRLISNSAKATFVNSMHGVRLRPDAPKIAQSALPLLAFNSLTMLGAEIFGRSYGGGILKMEPREAAILPMPSPKVLEAAWNRLKADRSSLDRQLRNGYWINVVKRVDEVLLRETLGLDGAAAAQLHEAARSLRERRIGPEMVTADDDAA
jgi:adenine-specific DNA-methyltransferase